MSVCFDGGRSGCPLPCRFRRARDFIAPFRSTKAIFASIPYSGGAAVLKGIRIGLRAGRGMWKPVPATYGHYRRSKRRGGSSPPKPVPTPSQDWGSFEPIVDPCGRHLTHDGSLVST